MITEEQLKQALNVKCIGSFKDGGTKSFRIINENITIVLYSTNKSSLITEKERKKIDIITTNKNSKRIKYTGEIKTIKQLLEIINKLKSLL